MDSYHQHKPYPNSMLKPPNRCENSHNALHSKQAQHVKTPEDNILVVDNNAQEDDDISVLSDDSAVFEMDIKSMWNDKVLTKSNGNNQNENNVRRSVSRPEHMAHEMHRNRNSGEKIIPRSVSKPEDMNVNRLRTMRRNSVGSNQNRNSILHRTPGPQDGAREFRGIEASETIDNTEDTDGFCGTRVASPPHHKNRPYQPADFASDGRNSYNAYGPCLMKNNASNVKNRCKRAHAVNIQELINTFSCGGDYYDLSTYSSKLDVKFYYPQELKESLYLECPSNFVQSLKERPIIGYMLGSSPLHEKGVSIGDVLLAVNDVQVFTPEEANRQIKRSRRPLKLLLYAPEVKLTVAEGFHMVKYDVSTFKPPIASGWKPKYVVIGGVISQDPYMMYMYRSKDEYDLAVMETVSKKPVSVKVKQFSLIRASLEMNDDSGEHMHSVMYENKEWNYILVLPENTKQKPIKIASTNEFGLKAVYDAVRRVIHQTNNMPNNQCNEQSSKVRKFIFFPRNRRRATM